MRVFFISVFFVLVFFANANAQYASQKDASYLAIIKAVANYKIADEEEASNMAKLRENEKFNKKLNKMIGELDNSRTKNSKNKRVLDVLLDAGKQIDSILNVN